MNIKDRLIFCLWMLTALVACAFAGSMFGVILFAGVLLLGLVA